MSVQLVLIELALVPVYQLPAGTFRLQDGTKIMGALTAKETILVWTDSSLYTMKFVGAPFTFGFEQVGTNCGLIGKNAAVEIDGVAYWMSNNGFFMFDGTVKSLPCSVEDYVYDDIDTTCLLYTSPSPRDRTRSRMPSSA